MRKVRRMILWAFAGVATLFLLATGAWIYVTSNVPEPPYALVQSDGAIEVRDYAAQSVAEVTTTGPRDDAVRAGFPPLARYIFARERPGEKIAMTAPVTQAASAADGWTIAFIMPEGTNAAALPAPGNDRIALRDVPARRAAAIRFSGVADDTLLADKEASLRTWLTAQNLTPVGAPVFAYYNDPLTPGFLRRNEVILNLEN